MCPPPWTKLNVCVASFYRPIANKFVDHRSDTDDLDFVFLVGFAEVVQELWTEGILPFLEYPSAFRLADNSE
jgi:hypothetical protein